jgi:hypothetical protein
MLAPVNFPGGHLRTPLFPTRTENELTFFRSLIHDARNGRAVDDYSIRLNPLQFLNPKRKNHFDTNETMARLRIGPFCSWSCMARPLR